MPFEPSFWMQPIDRILFTVLVWFGWIPIALTVIWGLLQVWKNHRQGLFAAKQKYVLIAIDVPSATEQTPKAIENLFTLLAAGYSGPTFKEEWLDGKLQPAFSFEIVSMEGYVQFFVHMQTKFRDAVEAGIYAHYPDAEITEVEDYTAAFPSTYPSDTHEMWGAEFTLKKDQIFPIRTYVDFEDSMSKDKFKDPLSQILEQLAKMRPGEQYWIQILCQVTNNDWQKAGAVHINKIYGIEKPVKEDAVTSGLRSVLSIPDMVLEKTIGLSLGGMLLGAPPGAKDADQWKAFKLTPVEIDEAKAVMRKVSKPGFNTKIRIVYVARKEAFSKGTRVIFIKGMFNQYANLNLNGIGFFGPSVPKDDYFWQKWSYTEKQNRLMQAYKGRSMGAGADPKILNAEELATLWHFPSVGIKAPLLRKTESRRAEPPIGLPITFDDSLPTGPAVAAIPSLPMEPDALPSAPPANEPTGALVELPDVSMPGMPAPVVLSSQADEPPGRMPGPGVYDGGDQDGEEREEGLDATDMGPPADVRLPTGPVGTAARRANDDVEDADGDGSREGAPPPNLPV